MSKFSYSDGVTDVTWKHSAHEDKWYVERKARHHDAIAEQAQKVRNSGGTKTVSDSRVSGDHPRGSFLRSPQRPDLWRQVQGLHER